RRRRSGRRRFRFAIFGRFRFLAFLSAVGVVADYELRKLTGGIQLVGVVLVGTSGRVGDWAGALRLRTDANGDWEARRTRCATRSDALDGGVVGLVVAGVPARVIGHCRSMEARSPHGCQFWRERLMS